MSKDGRDKTGGKTPRQNQGVRYQCAKCRRWIAAALFDAHVRNCDGK